MTTLPYSEFVERFEKIAQLNNHRGLSEYVYRDSSTTRLCLVLEYTGLDKEARNDIFKEFLLTYSPVNSLRLLYFTGKKSESNRNLVLVFEHCRRLSELVVERQGGGHSQGNQGLSYKEIANLYLRLREGVRLLHENNSFHGDLRRETIFIEDDKTVKLLKYPRMKLNYEIVNDRASDGDLKGVQNIVLPPVLLPFLSFKSSNEVAYPQSQTVEPSSRELITLRNVREHLEEKDRPNIDILQGADSYSLSLLACSFLLPSGENLHSMNAVDPSALMMAVEACGQSLGSEVVRGIREGFGSKPIDRISEVSAISLNEFEDEVKNKDRENNILRHNILSEDAHNNIYSIGKPRAEGRVKRRKIINDSSGMEADSLLQEARPPREEDTNRKVDNAILSERAPQYSKLANDMINFDLSNEKPKNRDLGKSLSPNYNNRDKRIPKLHIEPRVITPSKPTHASKPGRSPRHLPSIPTPLANLRLHCVSNLSNHFFTPLPSISILSKTLSSVHYQLKLCSSGTTYPVGFIHYPDSSVYFGFVCNLVPEDCGILFEGEGGLYEGGWRKGKREGFGVWYRAKGGVIKATWKQGRVQGEASLKTRSGEKGKGLWEEGKVVDWKEEAKDSSYRSRSGSRGTPDNKDLEEFYKVGFFQSQVIRVIQRDLLAADNKFKNSMPISPRQSQDSRFAPLFINKTPPALSPRLTTLESSQVPPAFYHPVPTRILRQAPLPPRENPNFQQEIISSLNRLHDRVNDLYPDGDSFKNSSSKNKASYTPMDYLYNEPIDGNKRRNMLDCLSEKEEDGSSYKPPLPSSSPSKPTRHLHSKSKEAKHSHNKEKQPIISTSKFDLEKDKVLTWSHRNYPNDLSMPPVIKSNSRVGVELEIIQGNIQGGELEPDYTGFAQVIYPEGGRFYGQFVLGLAHGQGIYYNPEGVSLRGKWERGRLVEQARGGN